MNQTLEQYSVDELLAAIAAKGQANLRAANELEQQSMRNNAAQKEAERAAARFNRQNQTPVQWAQCMAEAGLPVAAARVFAEVLAVIYNRLEAVEGLSASSRALNDLSQRVARIEATAPVHMKTEKRG
jgi:ABC-type uncharacterized transport system permease subunit